jgi:spore coat polysaccharide biosynthesis protein SpsF (cytidylyltransferase family)
MAITRHGPKPFAWSYSKLKNYEVCPKRHWHVDVKKDFKEAESEALKQGNLVHKLFENLGLSVSSLVLAIYLLSNSTP